MTAKSLDEICAGALDEMDRSARRRKALLLGAALAEAAFLGALLLAMNFGDRTHLLILISSVMVYSVLAIGLFTLGAHINAAAARILRSIELHAED